MPSGAASTACGILRAKDVNVSYNLFDNVGVIVASGAPIPYTHEYNNNIVRFYLQGNENYFLSSGNQPVYMRNNIFLMPQNTYPVNDGQHGGINVFKTNNIELYSGELSYFDNQLHFADIFHGDFHPTRRSTSIIDKGINLITPTIIRDLDGTEVPQNKIRDIGCYEFKRKIFSK
jgi:hypothetical protein